MGKGQRDHIALVARDKCKIKKRTKVVRRARFKTLQNIDYVQTMVQQSSALGDEGRRWRADHQLMSHAVLLLVYFLGQVLPWYE